MEYFATCNPGDDEIATSVAQVHRSLGWGLFSLRKKNNRKLSPPKQ